MRERYFTGQPGRRHDVVFDTALRAETEETARRVHELISSGITPKPEYSKKCKSCSLEQLMHAKDVRQKGKGKRLSFGDRK